MSELVDGTGFLEEEGFLGGGLGSSVSEVSELATGFLEEEGFLGGGLGSSVSEVSELATGFLEEEGFLGGGLEEGLSSSLSEDPFGCFLNCSFILLIYSSFLR